MASSSVVEPCTVNALVVGSIPTLPANIMISCIKCRKEYKNRQGFTPHAKTCGTHPTYECKTCGKECRVRRYKTNQYCSHKCAQIGSRVVKDEAWYKNHRAVKNNAWARYRARKRNQTPADADLVKIQEIYDNCPPGMEVDHIHPISKGGLHHQDNLQYLTPAENRRKSNKTNHLI